VLSKPKDKYPDFKYIDILNSQLQSFQLKFTERLENRLSSKTIKVLLSNRKLTGRKRIACKPIFQKINTLYKKASIEVEGKHFDLDILMGGDMKFLQLVHGLGGSLCNYSCPWYRVHKNHKSADNMLLPRRQITRRKLCFYYTCKFGAISIKYVIRCSKH
jgi:hypothetical protein